MIEEKKLFMEVAPNIKITYGVERQRDLENRLKRMKDKNKDNKKDKNKKKK